MAWREMELLAWAKALVDDKDVNGDSPGGAAARLGCTRQYVHKLIDEGELDAIRVVKKGGGLVAICVNEKKLKLLVEARKALDERRRA
jgi:excisionase family DNA binding protein